MKQDTYWPVLELHTGTGSKEKHFKMQNYSGGTPGGHSDILVYTFVNKKKIVKMGLLAVFYINKEHV